RPAGRAGGAAAAGPAAAGHRGADPGDEPRPCAVPPDPGRAGRQGVPAGQVPHHGRRRGAAQGGAAERVRRRALQDAERSKDHRDRRLPAPLLARRAAAVAQRGTRRDVAGGPAPAAARGGRPVRRRRAPPPRRQTGHDRALAGQRALRPDLGGVRPARPAVRGELVARPRPADPLEDVVRGGAGRRGVLTVKALVLAGGSGTRLRPITHTSAKQLVPVANKPVLFYGLEAIAEAGIREVGLVVGDTRAEIEAAVGDGSAFGLEVTYLRQEAPLGLAHGVLIARDYLGDDDFVMYLGDNFVVGGITGLVDRFTRDRPAAQIMLTRV